MRKEAIQAGDKQQSHNQLRGAAHTPHAKTQHRAHTCSNNTHELQSLGSP